MRRTRDLSDGFLGPVQADDIFEPDVCPAGFMVRYG